MNNYWASELPIGDPRPQEIWKKHPRLYEPSTTLLAISAAIAVIGAGMSAVSAVQQGAQAKKAAKFKSAVALRNAQESRAQAARDATLQRKQNYLRLGAIKAAGSASGLGLEGSVLDVFQSSVIEGELEVANIIHKGELKAEAFQSESSLVTMEGKNAQTSGYYNAAGAVISGAGGVAGAYSSHVRLGHLQTMASQGSNFNQSAGNFITESFT